MDSRIRIFYYTAWDGFAWQNCDEATASSLKRCMDATGTLPKSYSEKTPYGGAALCRLGDEMGVAVYRYHTRMNGDMSGRDSLYIALAFVPFGLGCIDIVRLLTLKQLDETVAGELRWNENRDVVSDDVQKCLVLNEDERVPDGWLDSDDDSFDAQYGILRGDVGLRTLSRIFFNTKHPLLGFLNAKFLLNSNTDEIVSEQTYSVYERVSNVAVASKAFQCARQAHGGIVSNDDPARRKMEAALADLDEFAKKQSGLAGLRLYHDEKEGMLEVEIDQLMEDLKDCLEKLPDDDFLDDVRMGEKDIRKRKEAIDRRDSEMRRCEEVAAKILKLRSRETLSFDAISICAKNALHRVSLLREAKSLAEAALKNAEGWEAAESKVSDLAAVNEAEKKVSDGLRKDNENLKLLLAKIKKQLEITKRKFDAESEGAVGQFRASQVKSEYVTNVSKPKGGFWRLYGLLDWVMIAVVVVAVAVMVLFFFDFFIFDKPSEEKLYKTTDIAIEQVEDASNHDKNYKADIGSGADHNRMNDGTRNADTDKAASVQQPKSSTPTKPNLTEKLKETVAEPDAAAISEQPVPSKQKMPEGGRGNVAEAADSAVNAEAAK